MLGIGDRAPDFPIVLRDGTLSSLTHLLSTGPVVVYFYPADFTPLCTAEACMVRDIHDELINAGLRIVGVSPQGEGSHAKFTARHRLPFPLVADPEKKLFTAWGLRGPFGLGVRRATFLVRTDGTIADRVVADIFVGRHKSFLKRAVAMIAPGNVNAG